MVSFVVGADPERARRMRPGARAAAAAPHLQHERRAEHALLALGQEGPHDGPARRDEHGDEAHDARLEDREDVEHGCAAAGEKRRGRGGEGWGRAREVRGGHAQRRAVQLSHSRLRALVLALASHARAPFQKELWPVVAMYSYMRLSQSSCTALTQMSSVMRWCTRCTSEACARSQRTHAAAASAKRPAMAPKTAGSGMSPALR